MTVPLVMDVCCVMGIGGKESDTEDMRCEWPLCQFQILSLGQRRLCLQGDWPPLYHAFISIECEHLGLDTFVHINSALGMWVCKCVHVLHTRVCTCRRSSEVSVLHLIALRHGLLLSLEITDLARLACQKAQRLVLSLTQQQDLLACNFKLAGDQS